VNHLLILKAMYKVTTFQIGVLIITCGVMLAMILYPPYKEDGINRGYASLFSYPTIMKTVPKYDFANEFYNFTDKQVRVPEKIYVFSSVNYVALGIQLVVALIIGSALWILGKAGNRNKILFHEYSYFNRSLSVINMLWFVVIIFGVTLPYLSSSDAPILNSHALLQSITLITPMITIWALHPHTGVKHSLLAVMLNLLIAIYLYTIPPTVPYASIGYFIVYIVAYLPESLAFLFIGFYALAIDITGAINAIVLMISVIRRIKNKPLAGT
jgi:hypothetical protein